jgi:hypothetical protein
VDETSDTTDTAQLLATDLGQVDKLRATYRIADLADEPDRYEAREARASIRGELGQRTRRLRRAEQISEVAFQFDIRSCADGRQGRYGRTRGVLPLGRGYRTLGGHVTLHDI